MEVFERRKEWFYNVEISRRAYTRIRWGTGSCVFLACNLCVVCIRVLRMCFHLRGFFWAHTLPSPPHTRAILARTTVSHHQPLHIRALRHHMTDPLLIETVESFCGDVKAKDCVLIGCMLCGQRYWVCGSEPKKLPRNNARVACASHHTHVHCTLFIAHALIIACAFCLHFAFCCSLHFTLTFHLAFVCICVYSFFPFL